jgi:hypothetical protein
MGERIDLMKCLGSIQIVRKQSSMRTNLILRCFDNLEGLNNGDVPSSYGS